MIEVCHWQHGNGIIVVDDAQDAKLLCLFQNVCSLAKAIVADSRTREGDACHGFWNGIIIGKIKGNHGCQSSTKAVPSNVELVSRIVLKERNDIVQNLVILASAGIILGSGRRPKDVVY